MIKNLENKAPAEKMWSLNGLKFSRVETPLIAPFHSTLQKFKNALHAEEPVSKHNNGDSLNRNESHVFLLNVAGPIVYMEKREAH